MSDRSSVTLTLDTGGQLLASAKVFSSGSRGYFAGEKVIIDGKRYQATLSLVEIGSKPQAPAKK